MQKLRKLASKTEDVIYAGLQVRLLANLIDCLIFGLFLFPLFAILSNVIYGGVTPSEISNIVSSQMQEIAKNNPNFNMKEYLENNKLLHEYFVKNHGFIKIIIDFGLQFLSLAGIYLIFWLKKQSTVGKNFLGLRIVDAKTHLIPSRKQFIVRLLALFVSIVPVFLGILWIAFDPKKQAWHDKIAGTMVIKKKNE